MDKFMGAGLRTGVNTGQLRVADSLSVATSPLSANSLWPAPDGVGDDKPLIDPTDLVLTTDVQPDDITTDAVLEVDGEHVVSTIDDVGDQDFFAIDLVAGQNYDISMFLKVGGPSLTPLADCFLELYDDQGNLIVTADGGGPNTPQGLDAVLSYKAETSGRYYINARSFDQDPINGETGDGVGDYELFATTTTEDPYAYKPYYSPDSPLHSIDWGTQIDRTSRNPDGDQGPRDNGEAFTGVGNQYGILGKNVVTYYLAKTGDVFVDEDPTNPGTTTNQVVAHTMNNWEQAAIRQAFNQFSEVADLVYIEVDDRYEADFKIITYQGTPGPGASLLGRMSPPNTPNEGQVEFNSGDERWTKDGLTQGGFYFATLLHEFGHGHGLAHPHDNGGHSSVMRGAGGGTAGIGGGLGDFDLSQQVFTIMSYNDGWATSPYGQADDSANYGWVGSLSAFDIAVIQDKYGVNEDYNKGDTVYRLDDVNARGAFYECIWDAGGTDTMKYQGNRNVNIDLRAATLQYEAGGGGWVSYADGIYGGFTIANAVVIERAMGSKGDDVLVGNDAGNMLSGGGGEDELTGGLGADVLIGGNGADTYMFELLETDRDRIKGLENIDTIDLSLIDANANAGGNQAFEVVAEFTGHAGELTVSYIANKNLTRIDLDVDGDGEADMTILANGSHADFNNFVL